MRFLEKIFDKYGRFVARNPLPFLIVPFLSTLISTIGLFNFHSQDDIWDIYAPLDALSRVEEKAMEKFESVSSSNYYRIQVIVDRKDGGNLMNSKDMSEIAIVNRFIAENLSVEAGGRNWFYRDLCGVYCNESNALLIGIVQAMIDERADMSRLEFTYPTANAFLNHIFMGYSVGGLTLHENQAHKEVVREFRLFILHYMINMRFPRAQQIRDKFESQLLRFFNRATADSPDISYALLSKNRELEEQRKITTTAIPFLFVTGILLTFFMVVTLLDRPLYKSQFIEAIFGIISPAMALVTTFGLVWGLGYPFSNILTVVPFLVITIGIDDAFLILAGWRHSSVNEDLEVRMGESVSKSGASVSVTSVTDVLCFGVGIFSNMPVVQLFCLYTSVALTIDFIYQMTFFLAVTVYCGRRQLRLIDEARINQLEKESNNSTKSVDERIAENLVGNYFTVVRPGPSQTADDNSLFSLPSGQGYIRPAIIPPQLENKNVGVEIFVDCLSIPIVRAVTFGLFVSHLVVSLYCCTLVNTDFDMENLYLRNSPLTPISQKMQHFVLSESFVVNFALNHMGNAFESAEMRRMFNAMVDELERIPSFGMGDRRGTTLWLRDYEAVASLWMAEDDSHIWDPAELLRNYRAFHFDEKFIHTRMNDKGEEVIDSFSWFITYQNMRNFLDVQNLLDMRREILRKYSSLFTVFSHHPLEKVPTESAKSAPANFAQTAVSAVILMSILVFLCILNVEAIICVIISILSISIGTVGYLHLWDVNLDAVSLISMLMSIGFSVDYSAHICYHFYTHSTMSKKAKQRKCFPSSNSSIQSSEKNSGASISTLSTNASISSSAGTVPENSAAMNSQCKTEKSGSNNGASTEDGCSYTSVDESNVTEIRRRLIDTLNGVGWPVVQSGVSTVLGMIPLFFVNAYVVDVFWKTIILVTALGMFHALLLLPILFLSIADARRFRARRRIFVAKKSQQIRYAQTQTIQQCSLEPDCSSKESEDNERREILGPITLLVNG